MDIAHRQTDRTLSQLQRRLNRIYREAERDILDEVDLDELVLDDDTASPTKRLKYAKEHGRDEVIETVVEKLSQANRRAVDASNRHMRKIYLINYEYACRDVIAQIQASMTNGGE